MVIKNGLVYEEEKRFRKKDLRVEHHQIIECAEYIESESDQVVDADGLYVIPGLIDVHSHGAAGYDVSDADAKGLAEILRYEKKCGITSYCPTTMTLSKERIFAILDHIRIFCEEEDMARIIGVHMEGPFLDARKKGAHRKEEILEPDIAFFRECNRRSGQRIRLVTVAPSVTGALEFIQELKDETILSIGHTSADYQTAKEAILAGAKHITHLYNAMPPFLHRDPGVVGAAAEQAECMVELICDGIHVHENMVRATFTLFPDRVVLISDSIRATGMKDGRYELGGQEVWVKGKLATLSDGTIAGSVSNLLDCMRKAVEFGISLEDAVAAVTVNPAKSVGIYDKVGSFGIGKKGDVVLLDKDLRVVRVIT